MLRRKTDETEVSFQGRKAALVTLKVDPDLIEATLSDVRDHLESGQVLTAMETLMEAGFAWLEVDNTKLRHAIAEMVKGSIAHRTAAKALTDESDKEVKAAMKKAADEAKAEILAKRAAQ